MSYSLAGTTLSIETKTSTGLCLYGTVTAGTPPTDASVFAPGALVTDLSTGTVYRNSGTTASPSWDSVTAIAAAEIALAEGNILVGNSSGAGVALNAKTTTQILVGNGTTLTSVAMSADATMSNAGAVTIAAGAVTLAKMAALARGSIISGQTAGNVPTALDAKTSGRILVGDGTDLVSVDVSGDATLASSGAVTIASAAVTRTKMSAAAARDVQQVNPATIATTGNTDSYIVVGETGTLVSVDFSGVDVLAANDTNYITFSITNLGQAGAGTTVMLAATDANTTKATGGTALAANTKRSLTVTATGGDLVVTAGDRLLIRAAATGTLANTVTFPVYSARFTGTT